RPVADPEPDGEGVLGQVPVLQRGSLPQEGRRDEVPLGVELHGPGQDVLEHRVPGPGRGCTFGDRIDALGPLIGPEDESDAVVWHRTLGARPRGGRRGRAGARTRDEEHHNGGNESRSGPARQWTLRSSSCTYLSGRRDTPS